MTGMLKGYEHLIKEPPIFEAFGGVQHLFRNAIATHAQSQQFKGEVFEEVYNLGREHGSKPSYQKGYGVGLQQGQFTGRVEGIKDFLLHGSKFIVVTPEEAKSFKTIDKLWDSEVGDIIKPELLKKVKQESDEVFKVRSKAFREALSKEDDPEQIETLESDIEELRQEEEQKFKEMSQKIMNQKTMFQKAMTKYGFAANTTPFILLDSMNIYNAEALQKQELKSKEGFLDWRTGEHSEMPHLRDYIFVPQRPGTQSQSKEEEGFISAENANKQLMSLLQTHNIKLQSSKPEPKTIKEMITPPRLRETYPIPTPSPTTPHVIELETPQTVPLKKFGERKEPETPTKLTSAPKKMKDPFSILRNAVQTRMDELKEEDAIYAKEFGESIGGSELETYGKLLKEQDLEKAFRNTYHISAKSKFGTIPSSLKPAWKSYLKSKEKPSK